MIQKIIDFLIKKKIQAATGEISQVSKTKIFMSIEGLSLLIEFISPYLGHRITIPDYVHKFLYTLAGISYAERQLSK